MREAVGNTFLVGCALMFMTIFTLFLIGSSAYSRAFNVKNFIIDTIELNNGRYNADIVRQINGPLSEMGYRVRSINCPAANGRRETLITNPRSDYDYCVYRTVEENVGNYYRVVAFVSIDLPFLNRIRIPISGETSIFRN